MYHVGMEPSLPTVVTIDLANASWDDLLACADICVQTWPKPGVTAESSAQALLQAQQDGQFKPGENLRFIVREAQRVIAHANCFPRLITVGGQPITILALAAVCTRREARKRGLGSSIIRSCFARVDRGEFSYSLFQTSNKNRPFYQNLGAATVPNRIINSLATDPAANPFWDEIAMAYPRAFPASDVDLLGPGV